MNNNPKKSSRTKQLPNLDIPNPFKALPWNVQKDKQRQARKMKMENSKLHRELGIAEDSTYEEITAVTQTLIRKAEADGDVKKKIKIEVAKDRILQLRLNERLAGLATLTKEARAQSRVEQDEYVFFKYDMISIFPRSLAHSFIFYYIVILYTSLDDEDLLPEEKRKEWKVPRWAENLIVKPDVAYRNRQIKVFGSMSLLAMILPPLADKIITINWLFAAGQIGRRGMSEGGSDEDYNPYMRRGGGPHQRTAVLLSLMVWVLLRIWTKSLGNVRMIFGPRYATVVDTVLINAVLGVFTAYTQTYKRK
jgi:hypothetical protein